MNYSRHEVIEVIEVIQRSNDPTILVLMINNKVYGCMDVTVLHKLSKL